MIAPPDNIIAEAEDYARRSPCAKSKRGAVIFDATHQHPIAAIATGANHPPGRQGCDGSEACRRDCGRRCIHAEMDALLVFGAVLGSVATIRQLNGNSAIDPSGCELVHVKIGPDGKVEPGGGPSCWQCSRLVVEVGIAAVWLFELETSIEEADFCAGNVQTVETARGRWHRYGAEEFHRVTCQNAKGGAVYLCP